MTPICSDRLDLIPLTPEVLRAALASNFEDAARLLGLSIDGDLSGCGAVFAMRLRQIEADPAFQAWSLRAMTIRGSGRMIGNIGFHTAPGADYLKPYCPEAVEFGFGVFPQYRRQGYAREASLAMMKWANETHGVTAFVLTIRPDNTASQALAAQLGFVKIGSHIDDVDGLEEILLRRT